MSFETVRYEVLPGAVARVTMDRPHVRNAQNVRLIEELDRAFDLAEADREVRVVVLAGAGPHFSAGHDLKEPWPGTAPEERWEHERRLYAERCLRIYDFPKPTVAQVQGACVAAGLMLACMCDLIVAAEDAFFQNPVLRMTAAGVELGVEVWELGPRKAKELLFTGEPLGAREAWRLGLVNRVVPRERLEEETLALARRVAEVEPATLRMVKEQVNRALDFQGKRNALAFHFAVHQFMHATETSTRARAARRGRSVREIVRERDEGSP